MHNDKKMFAFKSSLSASKYDNIDTQANCTRFSVVHLKRVGSDV